MILFGGAREDSNIRLLSLSNWRSNRLSYAPIQPTLRAHHSDMSRGWSNVKA